MYLTRPFEGIATPVPATEKVTGTPARALPSESLTVAIIGCAPASAPSPAEIALIVGVALATEAVVFPPVTVNVPTVVFA